MLDQPDGLEIFLLLWVLLADHLQDVLFFYLCEEIDDMGSLLGEVFSFAPANVYYRFLIVFHDDIGEIFEQPQLILDVVLVVALHEQLCLAEKEFDDLFL